MAICSCQRAVSSQSARGACDNKNVACQTCRETRLICGTTLSCSPRLLGKLRADVERLMADQDIRGSHIHLEGLPGILE